MPNFRKKKKKGWNGLGVLKNKKIKMIRTTPTFNQWFLASILWPILNTLSISVITFCSNVDNAPVILSRSGRNVVPTLLTPTFRRNWCWFRPGATLCHDVLRCYHAVATPGLRYYPVSTRLTSDTDKFSYVVLHYVTLPPRCSLAAATL